MAETHDEDEVPDAHEDIISDAEMALDEMSLPSDAARRRRWRRAQFDSNVVGPKMRTMMPSDLLIVAYDLAQFVSIELGYRVKPGDVLAALVPEPLRADVLRRMKGVGKLKTEAIIEVMPKALEAWGKWKERAKVVAARELAGGGK